jgi:AhpD family alkylhydroperoxidase
MNAGEAQRISAERGSRGRIVRVGLLALGLPQLAIGAWALLAPRGWYENFPGAGNEWLPLYGAFDQHLATDVGSTFVALGLALILAAIWLERRAVQLAIVAYLAYQLPHTAYHLGADDALSSGDQVLNGAVLVSAVAAASALLWLSRSRDGAPAETANPRSAESNGETGNRLGSTVDGPFARVLRAYSRRQYGGELAPLEAYLHTRGLLLGYGAFETATERASRVDDRYKALGELKAAAVVGCEWCMDFGSRLARQHGVPEEQLRELPTYRDSEAFTEVEKLVLDYATAMSRTPAEVGDELAAKLGEHFDDAQLVELTNAIAIENLRARFNHALGLDPQGFSDGAFCVVPEARAERDGSPLREPVRS